MLASYAVVGCYCRRRRHCIVSEKDFFLIGAPAIRKVSCQFVSHIYLRPLDRGDNLKFFPHEMLT